MKLYTYDRAPNPRRLAMFMKYKGIALETQQVDLMKGEQRGEPYRAINPDQTVPALLLDDGSVLSEVIGICTYLEGLHPDRPLLGTTPLEKARVISWDHRLFAALVVPIADILRNSAEAFRNRALPGPYDVPQLPEMVERGRLQLHCILPDLDAQLAGRTWLAGDRFSFADIDLLAAIDFMAWVKESVPEDCRHLKAWYERAKAELG
ncbi:MAG: glutathione S-transferase family protein [Candidatus Accumulibacter sp.]|uniref:glutathione S-transferase family protein n=1 Tax=Accumulibacter sp. TaxID=2053492 RepID=UPI0025F92888|nr:glutathione S-transferase family protein [Accumulibacter sp.]MCP5249568.1 glutathione S-transferase family protein [Accumulibacter sp.]